MPRLNPAAENYQIERLLQMIGELHERMDRSEADSHSPSSPIVIPLYTLTLADDDFDIIVWTGEPDPGDIVTIPINTLMRPDFTDPDVMVFPDLF